MADKETNKPVLSYEEVMKAISKLDDEEKDIVLKQLNLNELAYVLEERSVMKEYCKKLEDIARKSDVMKKAMLKLCVYVNTPTDEAEDAVREYEKLDRDKKKETALKLLNNSDFQKDCCDILVKYFERIVEENPTLKLLNDTFNISDWYKKNIARGIGCNHEYVVD